MMSLEARSLLLSLSCLPLGIAACSDDRGSDDSAATLGNDEVDDTSGDSSGDGDSGDDGDGDGDNGDNGDGDGDTGDGDPRAPWSRARA